MLRSFVGARIYDISAGNEADLDQIPDAKLQTFLMRTVALFGNIVLLDLQRCHDFAVWSARCCVAPASPPVAASSPLAGA